MLSVQLPGNVRPDQLSEDLFLEWLRMIPAVAECVKVEAGWISLSTLIIVSIPMSIWKYIEGHPAIRLVGIIQSPNLLSPKQVEQREVIASMNASVGNGLQERKEKGRKEMEMARKRVKVEEIIERRMEMWEMEKKNIEWRIEMEKMEKETIKRRIEIKKMEMDNMERRREIEMWEMEKKNIEWRIEMEKMEKEIIKRRVEMENMEWRMEMDSIPSMSAAAADDPQENKGKGMGKLVNEDEYCITKK